MKIHVLKTYDELSQKACKIIVEEIEKTPGLLLCTATGNSPTDTYRLLSAEYESSPELFKELTIVKLDEWGGIPMDSNGTCESYLQEHVIKPLKIPESRYISFNSNAEDPLAECNRIQKQMNKKGPIDLCILGIGLNGHIAFNEPSDFLQPGSHIADISASSLSHSMIAEMKVKPTHGLTLGMGEIFQSKKILMLINGLHKKEIVRKFLSRQISSWLPASLLWLHPNVICLIQEDAYPG